MTALQLGADTTGSDEFDIDYDPSDPKIAAAIAPSPDPNKPIPSFTRLLGFTSGMKKHVVTSIVLSILGILTGIIPYVLIGYVLAELLESTLTVQRLLWYFLASGGAYIVARALLIASTLASHRMAYRTLYRVRVALTQKLTRIPLGRIVDTPSGKLKKVFVEDIQQCEIPLAHMLPEITGHLSGIIVVTAYLFVLDWRLALGALLPIVAGIFTMFGLFYKYEERFGRYNRTNQQMNQTIIEFVQGIQVIKAFNQSSTSYAKYQHDVCSYQDAVVEWYRATQVFSVLAWTLIPSALVVLVPLGAYLVDTGSTDLSTMLLACALSLSLGPSLIALAMFAENFSIMKTALDDAMAWFDEPEMTRADEEASLRGHSMALEGVSFTYGKRISEDEVTAGHTNTHDGDSAAEERVTVLQDVTTTFPQGSFTALVGPSGAGKSTVGRLLAGYWDPTSGRVTFDGIDVRELPQHQLMLQQSYVTQDNYLFDTTIAENLRLADPNASDEELMNALDIAGCTEFIERLPDGIDTRVGAAGTHLSGGERQRITIARALLKDAPVVILDEATSYLDPVNEHRVQAALGKLTKGKTLIVIAHRLSTVTGADTLYVLQDGKVVETGPHDDLLEKNGVYAQMWKTHQAARAVRTGDVVSDAQTLKGEETSNV
ncbi:MAG: ABC transporter ATP-binding protein [Actinomycetaceae bacterium]|nr:ABC transporter ATP-binding protein [Actinomycetaceae bacterium]